jgi:hypothetical protein
MTSFEPVQAGPYLTPSDPPDLAGITKLIVDWAAPRENMRFASTTARDAAIPVPVEGMECVTGTGAAMVKWLYFNAAWADVTVGAWTAYTPTWTAATTNPVLGNGTLTGFYQRVGKTVHFWIKLSVGSTTTFGTGAYAFSLPPVANIDEQACAAVLRDSSVPTNYGMVGWVQSSTSILNVSTSAGGLFSATVPVTLANSDRFSMSGTYEAA